ncbi:hypothetical protein LWI29_001146 [Acer saccharum]|uniref:Uncharacterized protein n=1 Tax=Acer saccharum TaxID=4024 RepID=A0AA39THW3_ACESA|nr:hypothetical protein LWI29_001146 [Acer saccharum]
MKGEREENGGTGKKEGERRERRERSPGNCGDRGPWSRASSSSSSVDLQPVSTLQSPFSILHSLQIPADPRC